MTFEELLDDPVVKGISVGCCVEGKVWKDTRGYTYHAHAHISTTLPKRFHGYICVRWWADLEDKHGEVSDVVLEELAHLRSQAGHTEPWRQEMRKLGAPIPAHHKRRKS